MPSTSSSSKSDSRRHQHRRRPRPATTRRTNMVSVEVQPPAHAQTQASLNPPVVVRTDTRDENTDSNDFFATAVLLNSEGDVLDEQLGGTTAVSGFVMSDPSGTFFPFTDLSVLYPGEYTIRIDVYRLDYTGLQGALLVEQVETRTIVVSDEEFRGSNRPSSSERRILRKLGENGYSMPPSPS